MTKPEPPQVYFKTLEGKSPENKKKDKDVQLKGNMNEMSHLLKNRFSGPTPTTSQISFLQNLRTIARPSSTLSHQRRFATGVSKSTLKLIDYPEFLPPERNESKALLSKMSSIKRVIHEDYDRNKETISGFESRATVYPKYEDK